MMKNTLGLLKTSVRGAVHGKHKGDYVPMKVMVVASYAESLLTFRGPLLQALTKVADAVCAVAPQEAGNLAVSGKLADMEVGFQEVFMQRTGVNPLRDVQTFWQLYWLMRQEKPQVILPYTIKPVVWGLLAARLASVPHRFALITGLGYAFSDNRKDLMGKLVCLLYRLSLCGVEKVFFQNPDDEALFRELHIISQNVPSVVVNGSGIDVVQFPVTPLPAKLGFLLIARLLGAKGIREYVSAAHQVRARYPEARFRLVGWIDENPDAIDQEELDRWVREGVVEYLGKLSDVRPAISDSSVYVLPSSYREGTPRTVLEAMAMGRAVITTDAPGCRETVIDGENGFLVPVKNSEKLAEAMMRFLENPELVERMGLRSREIAVEKYDVHKVNAVMLREMGLVP